MNEQVIDVAKTLHACQQAMRSTDEQDVASAESVVSYLTLHLKHRKAPLPAKLKPHFDRVLQCAA